MKRINKFIKKLLCRKRVTLWDVYYPKKLVLFIAILFLFSGCINNVICLGGKVEMQSAKDIESMTKKDTTTEVGKDNDGIVKKMFNWIF